MCACRSVHVCACAHVDCIYMGFSWQWSFLICSRIPPKSYCTCLSFKLNEKSILVPSGIGGWRQQKMRPGSWQSLARSRLSLTRVPCGMWGVRKPAGWTEGGGGLGVRVRVHVSPHCPWGAAAREAALPGARARAARLYGIHATLQTQAWKLWVRKVPVVCFCCIQRNKILSTCFVNKPKTFLTPIINFSS